jgi:uncharacterized phage protein (TIGR02220 family)
MDHWIYQDAERLKAWIDLLLLANYKDDKVMIRSKLVEVKRGQRVASVRDLMKRWGWGNNKVVKFLEQLENEKMITLKKDAKNATVIEIENYETYQGIQLIDETANETAMRQQRDSNETHIKKEKKEKKLINKDLKDIVPVDESNFSEPETDKTEQPKPKTTVQPPFRVIIDHLNLKSGRNYKVGEHSQRLIRARWTEGHRLEDFIAVIDKKAAEWLNDPKYNEYLRPETLFSNKFDGYLNAGVKGGTKKPVIPIVQDDGEVPEHSPEKLEEMRALARKLDSGG